LILGRFPLVPAARSRLIAMHGAGTGATPAGPGFSVPRDPKPGKGFNPAGSYR